MALTANEFSSLQSYFTQYGVTQTVASLITQAETRYPENESAARADVEVEGYRALVLKVGDGTTGKKLGVMQRTQSVNNAAVDIFKRLLEEAEQNLATAKNEIPKRVAFARVITPY